ncbi:MAG TPA: isochorismatase family cysteine hydrolase [Anaerolineaceae bacterium]|nr:isochorismatase family cysteine hydrolase [Anaerolineaceae bacterium]
MTNFPVIPARIALVNVDIQNCFVEGSAPDGLLVLDRINCLAGVCRESGIVVFHIRHVLPADLDSGVLGEFFPVVKMGLLNRDSETAKFHKNLIRDPRDVILEKPHFGAFYGTNLELHLRRRGIDTIIITGIETNVCCETTAREAMVRDFRVFFLSDGTTTGGVPGMSRDEVQRASLATVGMFFAQVLTVDEMIQKIKSSVSGTFL